MLPIIFVLPIVQLLVLANAATREMKNINLVVVDFDNSQKSRNLTYSFANSPFYTVIPSSKSVSSALNNLHSGVADAILVIENRFDRNLTNNGTASVQLIVNAINGTAASLINAYTSSIVNSYSAKIVMATSDSGISTITSKVRHWYNPELNYNIYMVPGILVILVSIIGTFLTALNIVREKELGTIEQINVTPIKRYQFIIGKLIPFWVIALFDLALGLVIARFVFNLTILGSIPLLFGFASIYLLVALSGGLILSTVASNQQQVMFMAFFFMILFIMMSGLFTPTESMPRWAQLVNTINPLYYFMKVNRMIILKGSNFYDIHVSFFATAVLALITLTVAVLRYRKTVG